MDAIELLKKARAGDRQARDRMVEENVGLVWNIVKRFNGRGYDPEDLFQIGCIGLIKSIDHFNLDFEVRFSTYAVPMIMGEIKRFMRDDGMIKISRTMKENGWKIKVAAQRLGQELGRQATVDEIAAATRAGTGGDRSGNRGKQGCGLYLSSGLSAGGQRDLPDRSGGCRGECKCRLCVKNSSCKSQYRRNRLRS